MTHEIDCQLIFNYISKEFQLMEEINKTGNPKCFESGRPRGSGKPCQKHFLASSPGLPGPPERGSPNRNSIK